jgi:ankyrin repeat protein
MELWEAVKSKNVEEVRKWMSQNEEIDVNYANKEHHKWTSLHWASFNGLAEIVQLILENKTELNVNPTDQFGYTPFYYACQNGKTEVVKLLLQDKRTNINFVDMTYGWTPLINACFHGKTEVVTELLKNMQLDLFTKTTEERTGIKMGSTALDVATKKKFMEVAKLVEEEIKLRTKNREPFLKRSFPYFIDLDLLTDKELLSKMIHENPVFKTIK